MKIDWLTFWWYALIIILVGMMLLMIVAYAIDTMPVELKVPYGFTP